MDIRYMSDISEMSLSTYMYQRYITYIYIYTYTHQINKQIGFDGVI